MWNEQDTPPTVSWTRADFSPITKLGDQQPRVGAVSPHQVTEDPGHSCLSALSSLACWPVAFWSQALTGIRNPHSHCSKKQSLFRVLQGPGPGMTVDQRVLIRLLHPKDGLYPVCHRGKVTLISISECPGDIWFSALKSRLCTFCCCVQELARVRIDLFFFFHTSPGLWSPGLFYFILSSFFLN